MHGIRATRTPDDSIWASFTVTERQYDYDVTYRQLAPYIHTELSPAPNIRIDAGLRYDVAGYDYETHLAPVDTGRQRRPASTVVDYRRASPKLGVTVDVSRSLNAFAAYREGFRAPSQSQLFFQGSAANAVDLKPVKVKSYEVGVRGQLGGGVLYSASVYDMRLEDDILTFITAQNTREASNAGKTSHRGIELGLGAALTSQLRLDVAYAVSEHCYEEWEPQAGVSYSGNEIESAPRDLGTARFSRPAHVQLAHPRDSTPSARARSSCARGCSVERVARDGCGARARQIRRIYRAVDVRPRSAPVGTSAVSAHARAGCGVRHRDRSRHR